ncbi:MAG TPA: hypothetical protein VHF89_21435 [Solirubrobacteraceae bacterium]|nr:hypothetical protein [Solirubrobacteraceae bacterium]
MRLTALTLIALLTAVAAAEARTYEVKRELREEIRRVAPRTDVPIRLPARLNLGYDERVHGDGGGGRNRYDFELAAIEDCGGATACFLASFTGRQGGRPAFRRRVRLARGITGYFKPLTCGASCSPPMIEWRQRGFLYGIQAKVVADEGAPERRAMARAANSAIRSRPR